MNYKSTTLKQDIIINDVISIHYFTYMKNFVFHGESHEFWEFLCVDSGNVTVVANDTTYSLVKNDIIFHKPNEFHSVSVDDDLAPNLVVCSFRCYSPAIYFFKDKLIKINDAERIILANIIKEAKSSFGDKLDNPYLEKLERCDSIPFGSEQLIKHSMEHLLISLYRRYNSQYVRSNGIRVIQPKKNHKQLYSQLLSYLNNNIYNRLNVSAIARDNSISASLLQSIFKKEHNTGVIDYFLGLKIELSKQLIRNGHLNFTQISDAIGYSSVHFFSRQFKSRTGMTPSEYSSSIKALSDSLERI